METRPSIVHTPPSTTITANYRLVPLLAAMVCPAILGCEAEHLAPVRGTVTIDGRPLTGGRIQFAPLARGKEVNPGKPAFGFIGPDGSYVLGTHDDADGAVVGPHIVTIMRAGRKGQNDSKDPANRLANHVPPFDFIRLLDKSVEVVAGQENIVDIRLTSEEIRQFGEQRD